MGEKMFERKVTIYLATRLLLRGVGDVTRFEVSLGGDRESDV
jgi:hypothetical protein